MGRLVCINKSEKLTPAKIEKILAEQFRQRFPKDYQHFIQRAIENGQLSPRNIEQIRARERRHNHYVCISDQSSLIKELYARISDKMTHTKISNILGET